MADVFSRENDAYGGSFSSDGAAITFPQFGGLGGGGAGLLVQNLSVNYVQQITKIYELGTRNCYYIGGRSQGNLSMARIVGPRPIQLAFYQKFGDVCNAATNNIDISFRAGCPTAAGAAAVLSGNPGVSVYSAKFCVVMSLGMTVAAQDMVINEQIQMMFGSLTLQS